MADVFKDRLEGSLGSLKKAHNEKVQVEDDNKFIGFDAYKKAMDCLKPGDVVILTTPPAFRWVHFTSAIDTGLNWYLNFYTKIYFDWQHAVFGDPVVNRPKGKELTSDLFWLRFQLFF